MMMCSKRASRQQQYCGVMFGFVKSLVWQLKTIKRLVLLAYKRLSLKSFSVSWTKLAAMIFWYLRLKLINVGMLRILRELLLSDIEGACFRKAELLNVTHMTKRLSKILLFKIVWFCNGSKMHFKVKYLWKILSIITTYFFKLIITLMFLKVLKCQKCHIFNAVEFGAFELILCSNKLSCCYFIENEV